MLSAEELKTQGAIEAARDPHSSVDARAAEDTMMKESKAAGAAAFEFDPNATPEQKKAQMKAVCQQKLEGVCEANEGIASSH